MFARPKQLINSSPNYIPFLADEVAEPHPYMNIKVAAFTVSKKSINTISSGSSEGSDKSAIISSLEI